MQIDEAVEIWSSLKEFIQTKDRAQAAEQFVNVLIDSDVSDQELWELTDVDQWLEAAVKDNLGDFEQEEETDDDQWDERS
jgi:hypothetical protein